MRVTTAHILPARYTGDPAVTVTLTFQGIRQTDGSVLSAPGTDVAYVVTTGTHRISGQDMWAPLGFRSTPEDLLRALCSFLAADYEHVAYSLRGDGHSASERCDEYGAGCPVYRSEYVDALTQMVDTIEDGSWTGEPAECESRPDELAERRAARHQRALAIDAQDAAALTYCVRGAGPVVNRAALSYAGLS
ncbi:MAG TPA: hypothetical protein VH561_05430 [Micromonosporaceae bacterium]|jgi:hypothetical protein